MEQSPYDLFSSQGSHPSKKKGPPLASSQKSPRSLSPQTQKEAHRSRKEIDQEVSELLATLESRKQLLKKLYSVLEEQIPSQNSSLAPEEEHCVQEKTETLAGKIAQQVGEEVLPTAYKVSRKKAATDKERKGKTLGGRKNWLAID